MTNEQKQLGTLVGCPVVCASRPRTEVKMKQLLPMDYALLRHLVEFDGAVPTISIPSKLFAGEIPDGVPNLVDAGLIEHVGDNTMITSAGRNVLALQRIGYGPFGTATAFQAIAREALTEENETSNECVSDNGQFGVGA